MKKRVRKSTEILVVAGLAACAFLASEVAMPQPNGKAIHGKRLSALKTPLHSSVERVSHRRKIEASLGDTAPFEDTFSQVDACMTETMQAADIPGAGLALVVDGELVYERGYGVKHRKQGGAVDAQTLFRIASVQKMMTAAAVMRQVESGAVDLNGPVTNLIPELQLAGPWPAESITVAHLLTHTAAIPSDINAVDCANTEENLSEWAASLGDIHLFAPPGSFWNYSNAGYDLAGLVAERASGTPYHQLVHDWVWEPAGMMATTLIPKEVIAYGNYTYSHDIDPETGEMVVTAPDDYECWRSAPSGNGFTTVGDLARWAKLMMEGGSDVLAPSSVDAMQTRQVSKHAVPGEDYGYGIQAEPYGIFAEPYQELEIRQHGGDYAGSSSYLLWAPEERFAVALLANGGNSGTLDMTAYCALDVVLQPEWQEEELEDTSDPSTWQRYSGRYLVRDFYGLFSGIERGLIPTHVAMADNQLFLSLSNDDSEVKRFPVEQLFLNTFFVDFDADGKFSGSDEPITFIEGVMPSGEPTIWLRNRNFVGKRISKDAS